MRSGDRRMLGHISAFWTTLRNPCPNIPKPRAAVGKYEPPQCQTRNTHHIPSPLPRTLTFQKGLGFWLARGSYTLCLKHATVVSLASWCFLQCSMSGTGTTLVLVATTTISNACSMGSRISSSIGSCQQFN